VLDFFLALSLTRLRNEAMLIGNAHRKSSSLIQFTLFVFDRLLCCELSMLLLRYYFVLNDILFRSFLQTHPMCVARLRFVILITHLFQFSCSRRFVSYARLVSFANLNEGSRLEEASNTCFSSIIR
jgi:hypothetical protein